MPSLHLYAHPGTEEWVLKPDHADLVALWLRQDVILEYYPRSSIQEIWDRDKHAAAPGGAEAMEQAGLNFRGYSFKSPGQDARAVIFVDELEDYESATFVVLHELAHLHAPVWENEDEPDEEEHRADVVAAMLSKSLFDMDAKIRDVTKDGRHLNPGRPICPHGWR